jgi:hypothetical protein
MTDFKSVLPDIGMGNQDNKFNKKYFYLDFYNRRKEDGIRLLIALT